MDADSKKKFFRSCAAVFQGGGCRVPAFAGAYQVAMKSGLHFTEVAGTSGGAMMAALIGAGATPDFIIGCLKDLKFTEFLKPPEKTGNGKPGIKLRLPL